MGVDQPECGTGRASPAKWSNTNTGGKSSEKVDRRAVGCKLVVLKMACSRNLAAEFNNTFQCRRCEQFKALSALFSLQMRCACHFILNEAAPNSALALH
jgi:hypothetical protein